MAKVTCSNITYEPTKENTEEQPPSELRFEVTDDWFASRWFNDQSVITKQMIKDETGFTPIDWNEGNT